MPTRPTTPPPADPFAGVCDIYEVPEPCATCRTRARILYGALALAAWPALQAMAAELREAVRP